jgi:hypothetical protein
MLKRSLIPLIFLLGTTYTAMSQTTIASNNVSFSEITDCGAITQTEIFRRARLFIAQAFPHGHILIADKETGDIAVYANVSVELAGAKTSSLGLYSFHFVLSVECLNRKYRATIATRESNDLIVTKSATSEKSIPKYNDELNAAKGQLEIKFKQILTDLQQNVKDYKPF